MSSEQLKNFRLLRSLILQLKEYGLNPRDWRLDRKNASPRQVTLANRHDESFRLAGQVELQLTHKAQLRNLSILSL